MFKKKQLQIGFSLIFILIINFLVFNIAVKREVNLIKIPVSKESIAPRSKISESDIDYIEVPAIFVNEDFYSKSEEIINLYSDILTTIPKNSPFYKEVLFEESKLPDYPAILLNDNQVVYNLASDLIKLSGNSIVVGQKVDIYTTYAPRNSKPIVDLLVSSVRIIGVKDKKGLDVSHPDSNKIPHIVLLALDKEIMPIVRSSAEIATLELYAKSSHEIDDLESIFNPEAKILGFLSHE